MKKLLFVALASLTFGFAGYSQGTASKLALTMNYEVSTDRGIMSAWSDYGVRNGVGIGLTLNPDAKSSWYIKYGFSRSQNYQSIEAFSATLEYPEYRIGSNNTLIFNSLVLGWKRQIFQSDLFKGYVALDLGYNLATRSRVTGVPPRQPGTMLGPSDRVELVPVGYNHSVRAGLAFGTTMRIREYLDYYVEGGMTAYSTTVNINSIVSPSRFIKIQTGFIVKL